MRWRSVAARSGLRHEIRCRGHVTAHWGPPDPPDLSPEIQAATAVSGRPRREVQITPRIVDKGGLARPLSEILDEVEQRVIGSTLSRNEGNLSKTARELGIDRNTLKRKLPGRRG